MKVITDFDTARRRHDGWQWPRAAGARRDDDAARRRAVATTRATRRRDSTARRRAVASGGWREGTEQAAPQLPQRLSSYDELELGFCSWLIEPRFIPKCQLPPSSKSQAAQRLRRSFISPSL
jgi:hypothetical protein